MTINLVAKLKIKKTIAKILGKKECEVSFTESKFYVCVHNYALLMQKADGVWFDVSVSGIEVDVCVSQ